MAEPGPPDDPFGDKAHLDAKRKSKHSKRLADDAAYETGIEETHSPGGRVKRALRVAPAPSPGGEIDPALAYSAAFAAARSALLDVTTPGETSEAARKMSEAASRLRGFAWEPGPLGLPPNMPVRPLGKRGSTLYFQNPIDELVEIQASRLSSQGEIDTLFTPDGGYLWGFYAGMSKQGELRIKYEDVRRDLIQACGRVAYREGVFDPSDTVRGRGAWRTEAGVLVLHLGDRLWIDGQVKPLGEVEGFVYPREKNLPGPLTDAPADAIARAHLGDVLERYGQRRGDPRGAGRAILGALLTWNFGRGGGSADLDARLELGWNVCVQMGAALAWRPQTFVIGDAGTGKSTLQELRKKIQGPRLLDVVDPSSAGIYQTLGRASIGVSIDEFENEGDEGSDSRAGQVLKLARYASSGARVVRGGQDGVPSNYEARGVFGFSGINMPPLKPAEASRMAILMLHEQTDAKSRAPVITEAEGQALGRALLARIADQWAAWPDVLEAWRGVILAAGQPARVADQFGTLLAASHMVCHDGLPTTEQADAIGAMMGRAHLAETAGNKPNWERCVDYLMAAQPDAWRGNRHRSIGEYLSAFNSGENAKGDGETALQAARRTLAQAGLTVIHRPDADLVMRAFLAVPCVHSQIAALFRGSSWSNRAGGAEGTWSTALQLAPRDVAEARVTKVDGRAMRCVQLRLDRVLLTDEPQGEPGENEPPEG